MGARRNDYSNLDGRASGASEASGATRRTGAWGGDSVFIKLATNKVFWQACGRASGIS